MGMPARSRTSSKVDCITKLPISGGCCIVSSSRSITEPEPDASPKSEILFNPGVCELRRLVRDGTLLCKRGRSSRVVIGNGGCVSGRVVVGKGGGAVVERDRVTGISVQKVVGGGEFRSMRQDLKY